MAIEISRIGDYKIQYSTQEKLFLVTNQSGEVEGRCHSQNDAEERAKVLGKQEFTRIPVIQVMGYGIIKLKGAVTSVNREDKSAWVSMEAVPGLPYGQGRSRREKISLRSGGGGYYEATRPNIVTAMQIQQKIKEQAQMAKDIEALVQTLEKRINMDYFNPTESKG